MPDTLVTILVVPREQFSKTERSLESIFANTTMPYSLVYVDGGSPPPVKRYLEEQSKKRGFMLIRKEMYLAANQARNLAIPGINTKYIAFIDNDVAVTQGWLESLVSCAEETGAGIVGPLYYLGDPKNAVIHTAGAELRIIETDGGRKLHEVHRLVGKRAAEVSADLCRGPIDLVEFHCLLARTDLVRQLSPLDEDLISHLDHDDFCLRARKAGAAIYSEPKAIVAHLTPPPLSASDVPYFLLRWSDAWLDASVGHFSAKYGVKLDDDGLRGHYRYRDGHRRRIMAGRRHIRKVCGSRALSLFDRTVDGLIFNRLLERTIVRSQERRRAAKQ